jgi:dTDP-4-amino-4,6-dideoxygalactose transaminase
MTHKVPVLDLQQQYKAVGADIERAVLDVLRSGSYILGQNVSRLERDLAELSGCRFGVGCANGTDALNLALWAMDIGPGDEVITTPFTFAATVVAIKLRGATPVFVDVDEQTYNIDPRLVEKAITKKTRAILPIHLYGLPADMDPIVVLAKEHGLRIIEDNAQSIAATYKGKPTGSFGDAACISFYPTKNLGAAGDAGMIVTDNEELSERMKRLRVYGSRKRYYHEELGVNSRLDEMQAAVLLAKLPHLKLWNAVRSRIAHTYNELLQDCPGVVTPAVTYATASSATPDITHVWHQYTIRITAPEGREQVAKRLAEAGIGSMCYYPVPLHMQQAFKDARYSQGDFPISEMLADQVLSLPMYAELTEDQVNEVAGALRQILDTKFVPAAAAVPSYT